MSKTEMVIEAIRKTNYFWWEEHCSSDGYNADFYDDIYIHEYRKENGGWKYRRTEYYDVYNEDRPEISESDFSDWCNVSEESVIDGVVALMSDYINWQSREELQATLTTIKNTKPF